MLNILTVAVVGRVLIYVWMKFELPFKNKWLEKLHACDLCSGVWIYSALCLAANTNAFQFFFMPPFVGEIVTAILMSYIVHYFVLGWKAQHEVIVV